MTKSIYHGPIYIYIYIDVKILILRDYNVALSTGEAYPEKAVSQMCYKV